MHRYVRPLLLQIVVEGRLEFGLIQAKFSGQRARIEYRILETHNLSALLLPRLDRLLHHLVDFFIFRSTTKQICQHAEACALQSILEKSRVGFWNIANTECR